MTEYVKRATVETQRSVAAVYTPGQPLDELIAVARKADPDADVVEVPEWSVALVRHMEVPDHAPMYTDYEVVEAGNVLVWSGTYDLLYTTEAADFEREYEPAGPA